MMINKSDLMKISLGILVLSIVMAIWGLSFGFFGARKNALTESQLMALDQVVREKCRTAGITVVQREKLPYRVAKIGDKQEGYYTYSARDAMKQYSLRVHWEVLSGTTEVRILRIENFK